MLPLNNVQVIVKDQLQGATVDMNTPILLRHQPQLYLVQMYTHSLLGNYSSYSWGWLDGGGRNGKGRGRRCGGVEVRNH